MRIPDVHHQLNLTQISLVQSLATNCRRSILEMTTKAQSGHPGGSLSSIDYLALLYSYIISQTGEKVVISNGHISPAVYAILAEMGYIDKDEVIDTFRSYGSIFEGHVTRKVNGVWFGTGPLGCGVSAAAGFALSEKKKRSKKKVFAVIGDGEAQEGQVYEMMHSAAKEQLDNFIVYMDYNRVQLSGSLQQVMPFDPPKMFAAAGWKVIRVDGHDYQKMWHGLARAYASQGKPVLIVGKTIMGKGVPFMQKDGKALKSTWHGKTASISQTQKAIEELALTKKQSNLVEKFHQLKKWKPKQNEEPKFLSKTDIKQGTKRLYTTDKVTDCRTAYGNALLDLATNNKSIIALTADVAGSVKTNILQKKYPSKHIDVGIAEQHMVSMAGGMSFNGLTPFCSTFGAFMTSRAKDQARVNDINHANVKMVATHCGLSVGEDGPTHQAIDDSGSMLGLFNTMHVEPADPNHCDRIVRYIASHHGNVYMRMGRHKIPVLTKPNGEPFYDKKYTYKYGKCDVLRKGKDLTIVAIGSTAHEALIAHQLLKKQGVKTEVIIASSIKQFDETLLNSIIKTGKVVTVEDHNTISGLGTQVAALIAQQKLHIDIKMLGVEAYQLSGTASELYAGVGIDADGIVAGVLGLVG